ncbi:hypothetical protein [Acrocarpospora sp. B8E8]|uniref:hypothetical protein n=1 Tax=Acrocarpospora sp. B8E8 TaxID=3153572 RepID=UPI00325F1CCF
MTLTVEKDARQVERRLHKGLLECPPCGGRLAPWGYGRMRQVFEFGDRVRWLRPRRAICVECGRTQVLLPVSVLVRRRDSVAVIGSALLSAAVGWTQAQIGRGLGRTVSLVRGWIRRLAGRAERVRQIFTVLAVELDPDPGGLEAAGSPVADAVAAIMAAGRAAGGRFMRMVSPWELACSVTSGTLLAPAIITATINTNHIL